MILAGVWALLVLPAKRRRASHAAMQDSIDVGDEIITAGGLHAVVKEIGDNTVRIELAPGVVATLDRRAVAAVAREIEVEVDPEAEPEVDPEAEPEVDPEAEPGEEGGGTPAEPR